MKFKLIYNENSESREIEINSLEELKNLKERFIKVEYGWKPPYEVIIDFEEHWIRIYDYYIE